MKITCDECGANVIYADIVACEECDTLLHVPCALMTVTKEGAEIFYCKECDEKRKGEYIK